MPGTAVTPELARRCHQAAEPVHAMVYFSPHRAGCYGQAGITSQRMAYFASRSAPMGAVPAEMVIATFFNFSPGLIRHVIPAAWQIASPAAVLAARLEVADRSLRQAWGEDAGGAAVREAAGLARRAAERAAARPEGRPLFAAHAALDWPDEPHLVLWHAQTLLREFRGDAHVALLVAGGLDGLGALISHAATMPGMAEGLRRLRGWSEDEWAAAAGRLGAQGWLEPGPQLALSADGRRRRQQIEDRTDELAAFAYEALGTDGTERLAGLAGPLSAAVADAGLDFPAALAATARS